MDPVSGNDQELRGTLFERRERERGPRRVLHRDRCENSPERAIPLIPPLHPLSFSLCLQLHVILFQWCFLIFNDDDDDESSLFFSSFIQT